MYQSTNCLLGHAWLSCFCFVFLPFSKFSPLLLFLCWLLWRQRKRRPLTKRLLTDENYCPYIVVDLSPSHISHHQPGKKTKESPKTNSYKTSEKENNLRDYTCGTKTIFLLNVTKIRAGKWTVVSVTEWWVQPRAGEF